jgi:arabinofuranosyltransferase
MTGTMHKKPIYKVGLFILLLLTTTLAAYIYWIWYEKPLIGIDDANIYFVYMRNLAHGNGWVYNVGEPPVEGFTSMLWVCMGAFFYVFTSTPENIFFWLNVGIVTFTLYRVCIFIDGYLGDSKLISPYSILVVSVVFLIPGYTEWSILSYMETGIWSCLLTLITLNLCQGYLNHRMNVSGFNFLLVLLLLTRPESYLWGLFFLAVLYAIQYRLWHRQFFTAFKKTAPALGVFLGTIAALTIFRLYYFGYPLPNTYYAKVSSNLWINYKDGVKYLSGFFYYLGIHQYLFPISLACMLVLGLLRKKNNILYLVCGTILVAALVVLYTGGDHFKLYRFLQPLIPLLTMFYILAIGGIFRLKNRIYYVPVLLCTYFIFHSSRIQYPTAIKKNYSILHEFKIADGGRMFGNELNDFWAHNNFYPTVGVHTCGGIAYTYKGTTNDLLGLNNPQMAHGNSEKIGFKGHSSFNKEVFYQQKPDLFFDTRFFRDTTGFILPEITGEYNTEWMTQLYKSIWLEDKFKNMYKPVFIFSKKSEFILLTYTHQGFLDQLNAEVYAYYLIPRNKDQTIN